jgi:putative phosphoribosyl transferase
LEKSCRRTNVTGTLLARFEFMSVWRTSNARAFRDRHEAGLALADRLLRFAHRIDVVVLALPRGGVPVAHEVASALHVPLDVFSVRKLGVPGHPELAMGAIASGGVLVLNEDVLAWCQPAPDVVEAVARVEMRELDRRERAYRDGRPLALVEGRTVILVDDGLATGSTMRAAVKAVRQLRAARVIVASPVGAPDTCAAMTQIADDVVCVLTPDHFSAVGAWYVDFSETTDDEVRRLLALSSLAP